MSKPAATMGCNHTCPLYNGSTPHVGGPVLNGSPSVLIEGKMACRVGDQLQCAGGGPDMVATGSSSVFINGQPAARNGDPTVHGGMITQGAGTVFIG